MALLGGAGVYAATNAGRFAYAADAASALGFAILAAAIVWRWPGLTPWAVLATGGAYLIGREGRPVVDGWAAVVGVLLLGSAELAAWSIEHDARIRTELPLLARRIATLGALMLVALLVNFLLLGTAGLSASSGILIAAVGVCASVLAVGVVLRLLRA